MFLLQSYKDGTYSSSFKHGAGLRFVEVVIPGSKAKAESLKP